MFELTSRMRCWVICKTSMLLQAKPAQHLQNIYRKKYKIEESVQRIDVKTTMKKFLDKVFIAWNNRYYCLIAIAGSLSLYMPNYIYSGS